MNIWGFRCFHCQRQLQISSHGFCSHCVALVKPSPYCTRCGSPLLHYHHGCGNCLNGEVKWHQIVQISRYKPPLADWIHRFKFQHQAYLDEALGRLLLLAIKNAQRNYRLERPEVILPVPLFWHRQWKRGYNQADCLAAYVADKLTIPLDNRSLIRIKATCSQRELTAAARKKNVKDAFCYQPQQNYRNVAIVDDVITTGATLNAICSQLLKKGIRHIQVWALARA
ncbi:amidophosphoribosyltransferase [Muribacter muris]|uniref:Amidophosphoribosyltransferase n=1 Tax=Muribacter muris TaxID=67855 RepID=A0A4Y9JQR9_9PAST|nr:amidophosphoribosyltransferase [Muribacter muris]MBF0786178.1 amidophosphoribosyltransferase [Muribacter muris]MBF0826701.1 amidophosphoribosyltransferase [Muribacter muris]TFV07672.1 amidophosphoribosyltransferase [Muribacter muris]